jgi:hypothetical protein
LAAAVPRRALLVVFAADAARETELRLPLLFGVTIIVRTLFEMLLTTLPWWEIRLQ